MDFQKLAWIRPEIYWYPHTIPALRVTRCTHPFVGSLQLYKYCYDSAPERHAEGRTNVGTVVENRSTFHVGQPFRCVQSLNRYFKPANRERASIDLRSTALIVRSGQTRRRLDNSASKRRDRISELLRNRFSTFAATTPEIVCFLAITNYKGIFFTAKSVRGALAVKKSDEGLQQPIDSFRSPPPNEWITPRADV